MSTSEAVARQVSLDPAGAAFVDAIDQRAARHGRCIDHDLDLMQQSYRLRYHVYCVERAFLHAPNYPDRIEIVRHDPTRTLWLRFAVQQVWKCGLFTGGEQAAA